MTVLAFAMVLDALMGEPRWLWSRLSHPAVLMGRAVHFLDETLNTGPMKRAKGVFALGVLVVGSVILGLCLGAIPGNWVEVILGAILLAQRSLADHVSAVALALRHTLSEGRTAVAMIVGRDTREMDQAAVSRAAIESAAENLSDGVIAPLFWFALGGLPGLITYKAINTADSMIGYKTDRHRDFGWASARIDDLVNWIPARLTALLLWIGGGCKGTWAAIRSDARLHRSPNAGWPEAALSRALGVALAGPRSYEGTLTDFPFVNPEGRRHASPTDILAATRALWSAWAIALGALLLLGLL